MPFAASLFWLTSYFLASANDFEPQDEEPANMKPFVDHPLCFYSGHSADVLDLSWSKVGIHLPRNWYPQQQHCIRGNISSLLVPMLTAISSHLSFPVSV